MATNTLNPIRGSTAISALSAAARAEGGPSAPATPSADRGDHPRHVLGSALRAVGVFVDTAFRVVVLGTDGTKQPDLSRIPRQGARSGLA
ncbi:hypothetical protein K7472_08725 [Streptomyces sp. PTM05]|uniref:Uncharacterized protein n=1 Tax=Streptantibioticus parmotrematis TaxID=2873249 RepID=A0ABS7QP27_9ACTN|nr:hypothetical protein [Streptantibioticus parmotrematis]MBY8884930.1 hypothetical protein [Streptantibioticus parmotrematis]